MEPQCFVTLHDQQIRAQLGEPMLSVTCTNVEAVASFVPIHVAIVLPHQASVHVIVIGSSSMVQSAYSS